MNKYHEAIESLSFLARVGIASAQGAFEHYAREDVAVRQAIGECSQSDGAQAIIIGRMEALAAADSEEGRIHPQDAALATYLLILEQVDSPYLSRALAIVEKAPGEGWWAPQVARRIATSRRDVSTSRVNMVASALVPFATTSPETRTVTAFFDDVHGFGINPLILRRLSGAPNPGLGATPRAGYGSEVLPIGAGV